jgi:hypothetical protein
LPKTLLGELVGYFAQAAGLQYNPLENKGEGGFTQMKIEEVQQRLMDFEQGSFSGYGIFGDFLASKLGAKIPYRTVDLVKCRTSVTARI